MRDPQSLAELAEQAIEIQGEKKSMVFQGEDFLNTTMMGWARRLQSAFEELGLGKGDAMCLCMVNNPKVNSVFQGGFRTGATVVPVMFQLTPDELRYIFSHTDARGIVTDAMLLDKVREAIVGLDHVQWIVVLDGETNTEASPSEYAMEELLQRDESTSIANIDPQDTALMLYTSGTTGKPKGVMLSHHGLIEGTKSGIRAADLHARTHPTITLTAMPMAHIYGVGVMNAGYLMPKEYSGGFYVQETWFDPLKFLQLIDEYKCTDMASVPTMLSMLLNHPELENFDLTSLEMVSCGASPLPEEVSVAFMKRTGCRIKQLYGMTENAGIGTADRFAEPYRPGSVGKPYDIVDMQIVDDNDQPVATGEPGEILTRGPSTMKGYHKNPEATEEALRGGWMHTGDIGYMDEDGWVYVVDRKKDMIIKGGENIFPAEIENVLYEHPDIAEAAVIGVPDDVYGEKVVAFVVRNRGTDLNEEQVIEHVKKSVSSFKAPSQVQFVTDLPKSGVGKILRRELRDQVTAKS